MPSSHTGHFVQIWRPAHDGVSYKQVEVAGRKLLTTINPEAFAHYGGWSGVSRELPLRSARKFAKEYARAGFQSRVTFSGHGVWKVVLELKPHRNRRK